MAESVRPTWEQMATLEAEATRLKEAKSLAAMHMVYGRVEGKRCGGCAHLRGERLANTYYKCSKSRMSHSAATDWRLKWTACGLFQERAAEAS